MHVEEPDAQGERVYKDRAGAVQRFLYGGGASLLHENGAEGSRDYIYLNGTPIALVKDGVLYFVHTDHLGRPEAITNLSGTSQWSIEANAWSSDGVIGSLTFTLRFPGQYYDAESGTHYNYYRTYDPAVERKRCQVYFQLGDLTNKPDIFIGID